MPPLAVLLLAGGCFVLEQTLILGLWAGGLHASGLLLGALAGVVAPLLALVRATGLRAGAGLGLHRPTFGEVGIAAAIVFVALGPIYALSAASRQLFPPAPEEFEMFAELIPTGGGSLVLGLLAVAVAKPLAEELLFRGLVLGALARWLGPASAVGGSAVIFALVHGSPWMVAPIVLLGACLGLVVWWTGSLTPAWIGHGLFNLVAFGELCLTHDVDSTRLEDLASRSEVWVPGAVLLAVIVVGLVRTPCGRRTDRTRAADRDRPGS
jgi:membrane protease YdiL (CAAX protease family)